MPEVIVKARIEPELKESASLVFKKMGISMSDAIRLFLANVALERALPFALKAPNEFAFGEDDVRNKKIVMVKKLLASAAAMEDSDELTSADWEELANLRSLTNLTRKIEL